MADHETVGWNGQRRPEQRSKLRERNFAVLRILRAAARGGPTRVAGQAVVHNRNPVVVTPHLRENEISCGRESKQQYGHQGTCSKRSHGCLLGGWGEPGLHRSVRAATPVPFG